MAAMREAEDRHFWYLARNELIESRLRKLGAGPGARLIELGCGGGCVSAHLSEKGWSVVGVEGHGALAELAAARAPRASFWVHDLGRGVDELPPEPFEVVAMFDVIEHLESPVTALASARKMAAPGGWIVGTVPALMSLWSRADEQAGHRTRYDRWGLRELLAQVPRTRVHEVVPFHRVLVPLLMIRKHVVARRRGVADVSEANFRVPPTWINAALLRVLRAERRANALLRRVEGSSLWFALQNESG